MFFVVVFFIVLLFVLLSFFALSGLFLIRLLCPSFFFFFFSIRLYIYIYIERERDVLSLCKTYGYSIQHRDRFYEGDCTLQSRVGLRLSLIQ